VDRVPFWIGNVREETGDEVEAVDDLGFLVVVAVPGQIRCGLWSWNPAQAGEADVAAQAMADERLERAAVACRDGREAVDRKP
jgi:hypothetical protein